MTKFNREFDVDRAKEAVHLPENAWFRDLLKYWRPAGELRDTRSQPQPEPDHLRLAIRDGYLSFYRGGQSVAKVRFANGKLEAEIHNKYVYEKGKGQKCVRITDGAFTVGDGSRVLYSEDLMHRWIMAASEYAEGEKLFVDRFVGRNAGVIDLEAGLPWDPEIWQKKSAKRIDLVALEACEQSYRLVFWEAKLVTNSEARSRTAPQVFEQLKNYRRWLAKHQGEVRSAYQYTCGVLVRLHALAKAQNPRICDLGEAIITVASQEASQLGVDTAPRLIIDDDKCAAFTKHLDKLQEQGIQVLLVRDLAEMAL